jgi:hypothetical protein
MNSRLEYALPMSSFRNIGHAHDDTLLALLTKVEREAKGAARRLCFEASVSYDRLATVVGAEVIPYRDKAELGSKAALQPARQFRAGPCELASAEFAQPVGRIKASARNVQIVTVSRAVKVRAGVGHRGR